jgi:ABC-type branched-subunit amino acid transport system ATPase component
MPDAPILDVRGLTKSFGGVEAVADANFSVRRGSITSLIGPNGAGKTTAFNLITGYVRPDRGQVSLGGEDITGLRADQVASRGLVRTFQLTRVLAKMRVIENLMLAAPNQPGDELLVAAFQPRRWRRREREVREQALEVLAAVGLAEKADDYAGTLSGGQRKLLEIARALMSEPRLVLLDEPMAGVNPTLGRELVTYLERLRATRDLTILFVEHNMDVVMEISEDVIVMANGSDIAAGAPTMIRTDQRVIDAYLGSEA